MERCAARRRGWAADGPFWLSLVPSVLLLGFLGLLLVGTTQWLYFSLGFSPPSEPAAAAAAPKGAPGDSLTAIVKSRKAKGVGSPFAGWIREVYVRQGQTVARGQLLFRMETGHLEERLQKSLRRERQASALIEAAREQRRLALAPIEVHLAQLIEPRRDLRQSVAREDRSGLLTTGFSLRRLPPSRGEWEPGAVTQVPFVSASQELAYSLEAARREKRTLYHRYHREIVAALRERSQARRDVNRLRRLISQAKRYSPLTGIVTELRLQAGSWTESHRPLVRIDDPKSYRLVGLVKSRRAQPLAPGDVFVVEGRQRQAVLEKKLNGWGRELFFTWLILRPSEAAGLQPNQRVALRFPSAPRRKVIGAQSELHPSSKTGVRG